MDHSDDAERLNRACLCVTLDRAALGAALDQEIEEPGFAKALALSHPSLFSNVSVFMSVETLGAAVRVVRAIEAAAALPHYREASLAWAGEIARQDFGPVGALMGYDFHLTPSGPQLIEVNTNAGGAFLNAFLARAQRACCGMSRRPDSLLGTTDFPAEIGGMFIEEWRRQRGLGRPSTIAIVDDHPKTQYLSPEFKLAERLLRNQGFEAIIADPRELELANDDLVHAGRKIDLVYNRLVDFALEAPDHARLRQAYLSGRVVVTPNPSVYALLADKRNLTLLSDCDRLARWGLANDHLDALRASILPTVIVTPDNAAELWGRRNALFFKPQGGYGSKAAYRGDKLTRRVWSDIAEGGYVAQAYAPPSGRLVDYDGRPTEMKTDVRLYTYAGNVLLAAARLYSGQTTNLRTPGGGFAPLSVLDPEGQVGCLPAVRTNATAS